MLPVINLSHFINGTLDERQLIADQIGNACETMGFIYVSDHGVAPAVIEAARTGIETFFAEPRDEKLKYARAKGQYRGYIPASDFTEPADGRPPILYEAFLVGDEIAKGDPAVANSKGMLVPNVWPSKPDDFRDTVLAYQDGVREISKHLLQAFSLALGAGDAGLDAFFTKPLSNISLLHYLPRPDTGITAPDNARAHYDTNALTVLLPGKVGGLEAQKPDGEWMAIPPLDDCFVVNIGNMMACWSGGRFKSTMHRVHPPLGIDRYSIGYFAVPNYEAIVKPLDTVSVINSEYCEHLHTGEDLARFVASCDAMVPAYA